MALKKRLGSSTAWMSLAASGNSLVSFVIFIVLSRILAPEEIGLVAFALIFVEIGKIIVNAGFPQTIVQHPVWDEVYASTCFYLNLLFAVLITLIVFLIGAPLASDYYHPDAGPILQALSAVFFLHGIKAVHEGKLKREFVFRSIAIRSVLGGLLSGIVGIYLALKGFGVWALVWQQLINHGVIAVFTLLTAHWTPRRAFSIADAKHLLRFSSPLMIAQVTGNVSSKIFDLLIGIVIGPAALGFFRVGSRVLYILQDIVLKPFEQTALSALSRISGSAQQAAATLRLIRMSTLLTFPVFFGAAAVGPEFIIFAFGEKWAPSGQLMIILGVGIAPTVIGYQINAALTATGNSGMVMRLAGMAFLINGGIAASAVPFGLVAAAYGFAVRTYLTIFLNLYFFRKVFGVSSWSVLKLVIPSFVASLSLFAVIAGTKFFLTDRFSTGLNLAIYCVLGAIVYAVLMITIFRAETRNFFVESMGLLPEKFKPLMRVIQRVTRIS